MSKYRVFELAKEFGADSKVILDILKKHNVKVSNNFSGVGDEEYNLVKEALVKKSPAAKAEGKKPMAKPAATPAAKPVSKPADRPVEKLAEKPVAKEPVQKEKESAPSQDKGTSGNGTAQAAQQFASADGRTSQKENKPMGNGRNQRNQEQNAGRRSGGNYNAARGEEETRGQQEHQGSRGNNNRRNEAGAGHENTDSRGNRDRRGRDGGKARLRRRRGVLLQARAELEERV